MANSTLFTDHETDALPPALCQKLFRFGNLCGPLFNPPVCLYSLLHPTILVVAGYCTVQLNLPFAAKLLLLALACFASTWLIYHFISRPVEQRGTLFEQNPKRTKRNNGVVSFRTYKKRQTCKQKVSYV